MSAHHHHQDSHLAALLSPSRAGTFFAPFRSRSANPDGFDSKMKLWINAIEEWLVTNRRLTLSLKDVQQTFISDSGVHPDKECLQLVFSEMKRRSRLIPLSSLRTSKFWSSTAAQNIDPKGWLSWGVSKLVLEPAGWALSAIAGGANEAYSDLTDMSIADTMKFVCQKSLDEMSQNLFNELVRICKAERQFCFEWNHLMELISSIVNTIIDATDGKELLEILEILIDYLVVKQHVAIQEEDDGSSKLIKIANPDDPNSTEVRITKKDIAIARLLRAKEVLKAETEKFQLQADQAKRRALECYNKKEVSSAKSHLRSHQRLLQNAEQKREQLTNIEVLLEQLENNDSNMMILRAYKDGAEALKTTNSKLDKDTTILDDLYDATAEAHHLNDEMNQILRDISVISQPNRDHSQADLEAELDNYLANNENSFRAATARATEISKDANESVVPNNSVEECQAPAENVNLVDELEQRLNNLIVCQDEPSTPTERDVEPKRGKPMPTAAT